MKTRFLMLLLALFAQSALGVSFSTQYGQRSITDAAYGAACGTTSSDSTAIQATMDAASAAGGGDVIVPPCTGSTTYYYITTMLEVPSNVCLVGYGQRSLLRASAAPSNGPSGGSGVIGFYGSTQACIKGIHLDLFTNSTAANGIEVMMDDPTLKDSGWNPSTNAPSQWVTVENNIVETWDRFPPGMYSIWVRGARNVKVNNNEVNGHQSSYAAVGTSDQAGVEVWGVHNVEIAGNHIYNIGHDGIAVIAGSGVPLPNHENIDISIHDNAIEVVNKGFWIQANWDAVANLQYLKNVSINSNHVKNAWKSGIHIDATVGTGGTGVPAGSLYFDGMTIANNTVSSNVLTQYPVGMYVDLQVSQALMRSVVVSGNVFTGGKGNTGSPTGLRLNRGNNMQFVSNSWTGGDTASGSGPIIVAENSPSDIQFTGNFFGRAYGNAITMGGGDYWQFVGNVFNGYAEGTSTAAIQTQDGAVTKGWIVIGNRFVEGATGGWYVQHGLTSDAVGWIWRDNLVRKAAAAYTLARQANGAFDGTCPTSGAAINDNSAGCVEIATSGTTVTVTNAQVKASSRVQITQATGTPVALKVAPGAGSFVLTLASACAVANCDFYYEIFN